MPMTLSAAEHSERIMRQMGADLHDGVAQLISLALLRLDRVQGTGRDRENLRTIQKALSDALVDIRHICRGLLLPEVQELTPTAAVLFMIRRHELRTGTTVACSIADLPEQAPHPVKIALCRLIQEGLNNAFKHAGGQEQQVDVSCDGAAIFVEVADKGPGMCDADGTSGRFGLGLVGLRDRVGSIGGRLSIESAPGAGTRIAASLPLTIGVSDAE